MQAHKPRSHDRGIVTVDSFTGRASDVDPAVGSSFALERTRPDAPVAPLV
jgi:hypothetical protein